MTQMTSWSSKFTLYNCFSLVSPPQGRKLLPLSTTAGLTPLCFAIINGQTAIVEEYFQHRVAKKAIYFQSDVVKSTQQTIPHLLFQFAPLLHPKVLLKRKACMNVVVAFEFFGLFLTATPNIKLFVCDAMRFRKDLTSGIVNAVDCKVRICINM